MKCVRFKKKVSLQNFVVLPIFVREDSYNDITHGRYTRSIVSQKIDLFNMLSLERDDSLPKRTPKNIHINTRKNREHTLKQLRYLMHLSSLKT